MGLNPIATVARALATASWYAAGRCLEAVQSWYGGPSSRLGDNGYPGGNGNWQDAIQGWTYGVGRRPGDGTDAPAGAPIYWRQARGGSTAGHIALSIGGGYCRTTGYPYGLSVSTMRIADLNAARPAADGNGGSIMGWVDNYGGNAIDGITGMNASAPPLPPAVTNALRRGKMKIVIRWDDSGTCHLWDLAPGMDGKRAQYIQTTIDLERLTQMYGIAHFSTKNEWEIVRTRYGLGN